LMAEGVAGLLREKTRPPGIPRTAEAKVTEGLRESVRPSVYL
jgi:hypothetical protein